MILQIHKRLTISIFNVIFIIGRIFKNSVISTEQAKLSAHVSYRKFLIIIIKLQKNICSARDWDRIRITWGNPQSGCSDICSYLMGHYRCTHTLCYQEKLRYEANQVWMNTTFILQGQQSSGKAVET
jgi:hypothetical protein